LITTLALAFIEMNVAARKNIRVFIMSQKRAGETPAE
jgi:hypothetical protein